MKKYTSREFIDHLIEQEIPVIIYIVNGFQIKGVIISADDDALVVVNKNHSQMIYKSAVSTIDPSENVFPSEK